LTFSAGMVDIVGYIALYHWFVSHMTGNTVHLASELVAGKWDDVIKATVVIGSFTLGSVVGRAVIEVGARRQQQSIASVPLLVEAALIFAFICIDPTATDAVHLLRLLALLALLALAMGLQTATLTKIGPLTIHTTFVTGMLNKFAETISEWFFWVYDRVRKEHSWRGITHHCAFRNARFMALIWLSYMFGAVMGTAMYSRWNVWILALPVVFLLLSAAIDQWQPLAIEEEKEQTRTIALREEFASIRAVGRTKHRIWWRRRESNPRPKMSLVKRTTCLVVFMPQALPWDVRGARSEPTRNAIR
jgi:uncharacterized membrane protein YoaK (UPF0700 family)